MALQPNPGSTFASTFTLPTRRVLSDALAAAYATTVDHHDPSHGSNESTFGYCLYHFAIHEFCQRTGNGLEVLSRQPSFRFRVGEYDLACHRVGNSERESIWKSFPNGENAAHTMLEEQLWLPGMAEFSGLELARRLVLAHFGNADDGFRAAYLCVPGETEGTKIVKWAFAENIWSADQPVAIPEIDTTAVVPDEIVGEPFVRRKVKRAVTNAENG